jgi:hypothetical protein
MPTVPDDLATGFMLLTLTVMGLLAVLLLRASTRLAWVVGILAAWAALTAGLAYHGDLADFGSGRARLPALVLIELAFVGWLAFGSRSSLYLAQIPQPVLIGFQSFRIPVELLLAGLASRKLLAVEMTFYGRNFDVLIGISAVALAWWVASKGEEPSRHLIVGWNMLGLTLLSSVLIHGLLSIPYPYQPLQLSVPTIVIAFFPMVWLPAILVPIAFLLHAVSLRRAMGQKIGTPEATPT